LHEHEQGVGGDSHLGAESFGSIFLRPGIATDIEFDALFFISAMVFKFGLLAPNFAL